MPKQPKPPFLSSDDQDTWQRYCKTVKSLHPKKQEKEHFTSCPQEKNKTPNIPIRPIKTTSLAAHQEQHLDSHWRKRLDQGKIPIEAIIDLHGLTQNQAYETLLRFIEQSITKKRRLVLVITGKGPEGKGVIRQNFLHWLDQSPYRSTILSVIQAKRHHGGSGAFYVLLRRRR